MQENSKKISGLFKGSVVGATTAAFFVGGAVGYGLDYSLRASREAGLSEFETSARACAANDMISRYCASLFAHAVENSWPNTSYVVQGGSLYDRGRENDIAGPVMEASGLQECFSVMLDVPENGRMSFPMAGQITQPRVATVEAREGDNRLPGHVALIYNNGGTYAAPSKEFIRIFAKDDEACASFPQTWALDETSYLNL